jgi:hypothetical protein
MTMLSNRVCIPYLLTHVRTVYLVVIVIANLVVWYLRTILSGKVD